jgi:hypothetical protein
VTVDQVQVSDPRAGPVTCPRTTLAPGVSTTCRADRGHVLNQLDVDRGLVTNIASVTGECTTCLDPPPVVTGPPSRTDVRVDQSRRLALEKRATANDLDRNGVINSGDSVSWTFLVTNQGTVTVNDLRVDDPRAGPVTCPQTVLAPGESMRCRADLDHVITAAEARDGIVRNVATASGSDGQQTQVLSAEAAAQVNVLEPAPRVDIPRLSFTGPQGLGLALGLGTLSVGIGLWLIVLARRRRSGNV